MFNDGEIGLDLISFNIQRGRDHGLPGYVEYRSYCQVGRARSFEQLRSNIRRDVRKDKFFERCDAQIYFIKIGQLKVNSRIKRVSFNQ